MALNFLNNGYFAGKVGIGTESPLSTLTIKGGSEALRFERDSQETYRVLHGTSGLYFSHPNSGALLLGLTQNGDITVSNDQNAEYVRFDNSSSNVGIGTASPTQKLEVSGSIKLTSAADVIYFGAGGTSATWSAPQVARIGTMMTMSDYSGVQFGGYDGTSYGPRMTIQGTGNVGIGNTAPDSKIQIEAKNASNVIYAGLRIGYNATSNNYYDADTHYFRNGLGNTNKVIINSSGNVGIGNTNPGAKLVVGANINTNATGIEVNAGTGGGNVLSNGTAANWFPYVDNNNYYSAQDHIFRSELNGDTRLTIKSSGSVGIGTTSPIFYSGYSSLTLGGTDGTTSGLIKFGTGTSNDGPEIFTNTSKDLFFNKAGAGTNLILYATGAVRFNNYSSTNQTGTPTYLLGTDASGNVVKTNTVPGSAAGPYLPLAGGDMAGQTTHGDGVYSYWGNSNDLQIGHDASNSYINDRGTGDLYLQASDNMYFQTYGSGKRWITLNENASVDLFYNDSKKFETTSTGVSVTGSLNVNQTDDSNGIKIFGYDDRSAYSGNLYIDSAGNFQIRQTHGAGSGYMQIHAENYLELHAGSLIYTQANFRIYDSGTLSFGSGGDYKIKHNTAADNLIIHTDDDKGITLDNVGNATFTDQAFATTATSSGDGSSTLTTKGYVDGLITGATIYRGTWDPDVALNSGYGSPNLNTVTQTSGYYYICSADGTATPNGATTEPNTWSTGDWVIWNDDIGAAGEWQKIDNSSVLSGVGTGQTVALWEGANSVTDSETLGNAPITVSGNNTTFAQDITARIGTFKSPDATSSTLMNFQANDGSNAATFRTTATGKVFEIKSQNSGTLKFDSTSSTFTGDVSLGLNKSVSFNNSNDKIGSFTNGDVSMAARNNIGIYADSDGGGDGVIDFHTGDAINAGSPKMTILNNGNVGIGTTSPGAKLEVNSDGFPQVRINDEATGGEAGIRFKSSTATANDLHGDIFVEHSSGNETGRMGFRVPFTDERLTILSTGNVGIGTTTPTQELHVQGGMRLTGAFVDSNVTGGSYYQVLSSTQTGTDWVDASSPSIIGGPYLPLAGGTLDSGATIDMSGTLTIDGSSSVLMKVKGGARISLENANATDSFYIANTGGNLASILDLGSTLTIAENGGTSTFTGAGAFAGKLGVGVAAPHGSFDFYNQGTAYFNGAVTVDDAFTQSGGLASTFSGQVIANSYLTVTGQATPQIFMASNTAGITPWTFIARNDGYFLLGRSGVSNDFYLDASGNATFGGTIASGNQTIIGGSGGNGQVDISRTSGAAIRLQSQSALGRIGTSSNHPLHLMANDTTALTLSTSQNATFAGSLTTSDDITIDNSSPELYFKTGATHYSWMVAAQENVNQNFEITPSTAVGGTTFSTPALKINGSDSAATFAGNAGVGGVLPLSNGGAGATLLGVHDSGVGGWAVTKYTNGSTGTAAGDGAVMGMIGINAYVFNYEAGNLQLGTNGATRLTIASTGAANFTSTVTSPTFLGDLNGTINTVTTAVTKANATNDTTVATTAFVQNLIGQIPAGLRFEGTWDARTVAEGGTGNPPSASPANGQFWIVSVDGSINLSGITDWKVGDWAIYVEDGAGTDGWQKVDNSSVLDGSGLGGTVTGWAGSGTSNTLTNAPITYSGNNTTFAGNVSLTGGSLSISGDGSNAVTLTESGNGDFTIDAPDDIRLDAGGGDVVLRTGGTEFGRISSFSNALRLASSVANEDILLMPNGTGNVGIGTNSPSAKLDVISTGTNVAEFSGAANATVTFKGSGFVEAKIQCGGEAVFGSTNNFPTSFVTNNTEKMRILANGNVGIGTTSPGAKLQVGTRGTAGALTPPTTDGILFDFHNDGSPYTRHAAIISQAGDTTEAVIDFWTKEASGTNSKKMTLRGDGNVGIGTANPTQDLTLYRSSGDTNFLISSNNGASQIFFGDTESDNIGKIDYDHSDNSLNFAVNAAERMRITSTGNVGIGTTSPSAKLQVNNQGEGEFAGGNSATAGDSHLMLKDEGGTTRTLMSGPSIVFQTPANADGTNIWATSRLLGSPAAAGSARGTFSIQVRDQYDPLSDGTSWNWRTALTAINTGNVGVGTNTPSSKLQVAGGIQMADDTATATADKVGTQRYRETGGASYVDMVMRTGATTYEWINIVRNVWSV